MTTKSSMFLLLASLLVGGGCTDTTSGGVPSTQSDAISPDALSPDSIAPECGKVDSPTYCTAPFSDDTHVANDSDATSEEDTVEDDTSTTDTFGPTEDTFVTTTDPCESVRVIEGTWNRIDFPGSALITCTIESNMTCSLEVTGEDAFINHVVINNVTDLPASFTDQGYVMQIDYSDNLLYFRLFTAEGKPDGKAIFQR